MLFRPNHTRAWDSGKVERYKDQITIQAYDEHAADFNTNYAAVVPDALYDVIKGFFHRGGETADTQHAGNTISRLPTDYSLLENCIYDAE